MEKRQNTLKKPTPARLFKTQTEKKRALCTLLAIFPP
jgi:hypothetical protein